MLVERPAVVAQGFAFYEKRHKLLQEKFTIVYTDETWVDTLSTVAKCWQHKDVHGVMPPYSRGQRLIVVHAGSKNGFVEGAQLVYKASACTGDYHKEMNAVNFTKWLTEKLIPNLSPNSAIVLDNAKSLATTVFELINAIQPTPRRPRYR